MNQLSHLVWSARLQRPLGGTRGEVLNSARLMMDTGINSMTATAADRDDHAQQQKLVERTIGTTSFFRVNRGKKAPCRNSQSVPPRARGAQADAQSPLAFRHHRNLGEANGKIKQISRLRWLEMVRAVMPRETLLPRR